MSDNGITIVAIALEKVSEHTEETLVAPLMISAYELLQAAMLEELASNIARRAKFIPVPESEEDFKKRTGRY